MKTIFLDTLVAQKRLLRFNIAKILTSQISPINSLNHPFFVIATPGNLHITKCCLHFIPPDIDVVIILNGLDNWENKWAKDNFNRSMFIKFPMLIGHDQVIDYLLDRMDQPFGIIDDDCFVFSYDHFQNIRQISSSVTFNAFFGFENPELGLVFPETFFLFMNNPNLKKIKKEYKVGAFKTTWDQLPRKVKRKIAEIGFSKTMLPENHKTYFDTLRVLMVLSLVNNYEFRFIYNRWINYLNISSENIFHVGAVTAVPFRGVNTMSKSRTRGSFFWYRVLEKFPQDDIKQIYYEKYGYRNSEEVLNGFPNARERIGKDFFEAVEKVLTSIS